MSNTSNLNDPPVAPRHLSPNAWPESLGAIGEPISLYRGTVELKQNDKSFHAEATLCLDWLPSPNVRFELAAVPTDVFPRLGEISLRLTDGTEIPRAFATGMNSTNDERGYRSSLSGIIGQRVIRPIDAEISYALFLLPNFDAPIGRGLSYRDGSQRAARLVLVSSGWRITLDAVEKQKDAMAFLKDHSGFAITQVGRLEREDGKPFTAEQAFVILEALRWYCSFAQGRWTAPCLTKGFDLNGLQRWEAWDYGRTVPYRQRRTWMDSCNGSHFEVPFPGFLKLWEDDNWEEIVRQAIHWHIEANAQAGSIEGSIVLTQTAFELLASGVLVENHGWLSTDGYEKLAAADRIRLLFLWAGVPTTIPPEMDELTRAAKSDNWPDSPTAMTFIRNTITHPTRKNREKFGKHPSGVRTDVWSLGLWCLELCLLHLFEYRGTYGNRLTQKFTGEVVPVPWADVTTK